MLGAIPSSLIAELAQDPLTTATERGDSAGEAVANGVHSRANSVMRKSSVASPVRHHRFSIPKKISHAGIALLADDNSSSDEVASGNDSFPEEDDDAFDTDDEVLDTPQRIVSQPATTLSEQKDRLDVALPPLFTRPAHVRSPSSETEDARSILRRLEQRTSVKSPISPTAASKPGIGAKASLKPPLNEVRTVRLPITDSDNIGMSLMHYEHIPSGAHRVFVATVSTAARKSGIVVGDIILEVNGNSVESLFPDEVS